jgi:hypothetical protein
MGWVRGSLGSSQFAITINGGIRNVAEFIKRQHVVLVGVNPAHGSAPAREKSSI